MDKIYGSGPPRPENTTNPFFNTWQASPVIGGSPVHVLYNWDLYSSHPRRGVDTILRDQEVVVGTSLNVPEPDEATSQYFQAYLAPDEPSREPLVGIYYPMLGKVVKNHVNQQFEGQDDWRNLIRNILPEKSDGIVVTIGNACNQSFSYLVKGPEVELIKDGDLKVMGEKKRLALKDLVDESTSTSALPLTTSFCPYWVEAYPSEVMAKDYLTADPIYYTTIVASAFVFTSLVFILYVYVNERRQKTVLTSALRSNAIVTSLFPSVVRDRLFAANEADKLGDKSSSPIGNDDEDLSPGRPIAELYPETTVCKSIINIRIIKNKVV